MAALTKTAVVLGIARKQALPAASVACTSKRSQSNLAAYKRGTGGRSSFSGLVVTVFGAGGFVGNYVVNRLGKIGSQIIIPYRGDPYFQRHLKLAGDLGQVLFQPFDIRDEESIRKSMKYSNVVINMLGKDWETRNFTFKDVHVTAAQRIARIAREEGVQKLIHFSHLNASLNPQKIYMKQGSQYLITKCLGEQIVREEFPDAVIFRPSDIFGSEDRFLLYYTNDWRRHLRTIPLWKRGTATLKKPVFASDIAAGVVSAVLDPESDGNVYECVGPKMYRLSDIVDYILRCTRRDGAVYRFYVTPSFKAKVAWFSQMPSYPILNFEKLEREHITDQHTGKNPTLEDLGIKLTPFEEQAKWIVKPFKAHSYYDEKIGEFPDPAPPPALI